MKTLQTLEFTKLSPEAITPKKAHDSDAGLDLYSYGVEESNEELLTVKLKTGISFKIPQNHFLSLHLRSSSSKKEYMLANGTGIIDEDYLGECFVVLRFFSAKAFYRFLAKKEYEENKIAQVILLEKPPYQLKEVPLEVFKTYNTERGQGGYGSTGN